MRWSEGLFLGLECKILKILSSNLANKFENKNKLKVIWWQKMEGVDVKQIRSKVENDFAKVIFLV